MKWRIRNDIGFREGEPYIPQSQFEALEFRPMLRSLYFSQNVAIETVGRHANIPYAIAPHLKFGYAILQSSARSKCESAVRADTAEFRSSTCLGPKTEDMAISKRSIGVEFR